VASTASAVAWTSLWIDPMRQGVILVDPGLSPYLAATAATAASGARDIASVEAT
jgi:hypothetical protein